MSTHTIARRISTLAAAVAAGLAAWAVAAPLAGIDLAVRQGGEVRPIGAASVAVACLVAGSAGWALLAVLERNLRRPDRPRGARGVSPAAQQPRPDRPRRAWLAIALVTLVLSLLGPAGAVHLAGGLALVGLHLIVGAVLIFGLASTARPRAIPPGLAVVGLFTATVALLPALLPAL